MIFSNNIYKIVDGYNISLYAKDNSNLYLYLFSNELDKYNILINQNKTTLLLDKFNYKKVIKLNQNTTCISSEGFSTLINDGNL